MLKYTETYCLHIMLLLCSNIFNHTEHHDNDVFNIQLARGMLMLKHWLPLGPDYQMPQNMGVTKVQVSHRSGLESVVWKGSASFKTFSGSGSKIWSYFMYLDPQIRTLWCRRSICEMIMWLFQCISHHIWHQYEYYLLSLSYFFFNDI